MQKPLEITVTPGNETRRPKKVIVDSVLQDHVLPKGDVGAYLVAVFRCQPLANDGKSYDLLENAQRNHCLYKREWEAALQGRDEFNPQQKSLILAGAQLLRTYSHGWGKQAIAQPHVKKLIQKWENENQSADVLNAFEENKQVDLADDQEDGYLPTKEDCERAYRKIAGMGQEVLREALLDQLETDMKGTGKTLHPQWRSITKTNLGEWFNK